MPRRIAQPIDQRRQIARLIEIARAHRPPGERLGQQRLDHLGLQDRALDAEAEVDALELLGEQALELAGIAARPAGADGDRGGAVVDPIEGKRQPPGAQARRRQPGAQLGEQAPGHRRERLGMGDRLGEGQLGAMRRRRRARRDRLVDQALRLIEPRGQRLAEARDQRPARQGIEALDPLQPQALQHLDGIGIQPQRGHGQRRQRHPGAARRHDLRRIIAVAGERPGGPGRIGDRRGHGQTLAAQPGEQVRAQRRLAAEQMGAAGDVQPERAAAGARWLRSMAT